MTAPPLAARKETEALLFDAGGTLIRLDGERFCRAAGIAYRSEKFRQAEAEGTFSVSAWSRQNRGSTDRERLPVFLEAVLRGLGIEDAAERQRAAGRVAEEHRRSNLWSHPSEGAAETLEALKARGYRLGVVSNADGRVRSLLDRAGLSRLLELVLDSSEVGFEKPDPRIFLAATKRLRLAPEACTYVGDIYEIDILGAQAAGLQAILIGSCPAPDEPPRVASLPALLPLFPPRSSARFLQAESQEDLARARELFLEYAESLGIDLCFQNFEQELAGLPGDYARPNGRLFLLRMGSEIAGCVALRKIEQDICEMKRLYVRKPFRGGGLGRALAEEIIREARRMGYRKMCLDTLPSMAKAIGLYRSLGFREIPPYRHNPIPGALFLEIDLA